MYTQISRKNLISDVERLRALFRNARQILSENSQEIELREIVARNLLSNLHRMKAHPTLNTLLEVGHVFRLTLDGAHRLFGYRLDEYRSLDLHINSAFTHLSETYPFSRDAVIELPRVLQDKEFRTETLGRLVTAWQRQLPISSLENGDWSTPGSLYVHVGNQDGIGSGMPPGSVAMVSPVAQRETLQPDPRSVYLLQFGSGYICSRCVVSRGKLLLLSKDRAYYGPKSFAYPGHVRLVGRVRMFAVELPLSERGIPHSHFPTGNADLLLPWEHSSLGSLLATEFERFEGFRRRDDVVRKELERALHSRLSPRTERRYRNFTRSVPHVSTLLQLSLLSGVRYTDALRAMRVLPSDRHRYSLDRLLNASSLEEVQRVQAKATAPLPTERWSELRSHFPEWPALLSVRYPQPSALGGAVIQLHEARQVRGAEPTLSKGSLLLVRQVSTLSSFENEEKLAGWARPLYALWRGAELVIGHLSRAASSFVIEAEAGRSPTTLQESELAELTQVVGIAVPV